MPYAVTDDEVKIYFEEAGSGFPLIFVHEYAGDHRSWEPQIRYFSRRYRCITMSARGYPPSDVPDDDASYSQARAVADVNAVLDHLGIAQAHVVGFSMGSYTALHFGLNHPDKARSIAVIGCGSGSHPEMWESFKVEAEVLAARFETEGSAAAAEKFAAGPTRVQFQNKDPRGWAEFARMLAEHSAKGMALIMRNIQKNRPTVWDLVDGMKAMTVPTLLMTGDEDEPCLEANLLMKRSIPTAGLVVVPHTGHTVNLEEPEAFNRALSDFLAMVEADRWPTRDPRSQSGVAMGVK